MNSRQRIQRKGAKAQRRKRVFVKRASCVGSAPAPGAANDAPVVGILRARASERVRMSIARNVRREGAPNRSRGGCAPHSFFLCVSAPLRLCVKN